MRKRIAPPTECELSFSTGTFLNNYDARDRKLKEALTMSTVGKRAKWKENTIGKNTIFDSHWISFVILKLGEISSRQERLFSKKFHVLVVNWKLLYLVFQASGPASLNEKVIIYKQCFMSIRKHTTGPDKICIFLWSPFLRNCFLCWDHWNGDVTPTLDVALLCGSRAGYDLGRESEFRQNLYLSKIFGMSCLIG